MRVRFDFSSPADRLTSVFSEPSRRRSVCRCAGSYAESIVVRSEPASRVPVWGMRRNRLEALACGFRAVFRGAPRREWRDHDSPFDELRVTVRDEVRLLGLTPGRDSGTVPGMSACCMVMSMCAAREGRCRSSSS